MSSHGSRSRSSICLTLVLALAGTACQAKSTAQAPSESASPTHAARAEAPGTDNAPPGPAEPNDPAPPPEQQQVQQQVQQRVQQQPPGSPIGGAKARAVSVREVLASGALVGELVRVRGRCLGYGRSVAAGTPPRTRSDWQLEMEGVAVYVTGAFPTGCTTRQGSPDPITILARVAEDTLPALGDYPRAPRRYLVRVD